MCRHGRALLSRAAAPAMAAGKYHLVTRKKKAAAGNAHNGAGGEYHGQSNMAAHRAYASAHPLATLRGVAQRGPQGSGRAPARR